MADEKEVFVYDIVNYVSGTSLLIWIALIPIKIRLLNSNKFIK